MTIKIEENPPEWIFFYFSVCTKCTNAFPAGSRKYISVFIYLSLILPLIN